MPKLIVGLGNPGPQYEKTRHNVGFMALDRFAATQGATVEKQDFHGLTTLLRWGAAREQVILLKPLTYMNLSGRAITAAARFYKIEPADILVVYDDLDLPPGKLRLREMGSAGGHNGIKSTIQELGTQAFPRLRIGIGRPAPGWAVPDWVLAPFGEDDLASIAAALPKAALAIGDFLDLGILKAMTKHNG